MQSRAMYADRQLNKNLSLSLRVRQCKLVGNLIKLLSAAQSQATYAGFLVTFTNACIVCLDGCRPIVLQAGWLWLQGQAWNYRWGHTPRGRKGVIYAPLPCCLMLSTTGASAYTVLPPTWWRNWSEESESFILNNWSWQQKVTEQWQITEKTKHHRLKATYLLHEYLEQWSKYTCQLPY